MMEQSSLTRNDEWSLVHEGGGEGAYSYFTIYNSARTELLLQEKTHISLFVSRPRLLSPQIQTQYSLLTKYSKPTHPHISFTQCVNCGACSILIFDTLYLTFSGALQDRIFSYWETLIIWNGVQVQCLAETRAEKVEKI